MRTFAFDAPSETAACLWKGTTMKTGVGVQVPRPTSPSVTGRYTHCSRSRARQRAQVARRFDGACGARWRRPALHLGGPLVTRFFFELAPILERKDSPAGRRTTTRRRACRGVGILRTRAREAPAARALETALDRWQRRSAHGLLPHHDCAKSPDKRQPDPLPGVSGRHRRGVAAPLPQLSLDRRISPQR